jgi:hypothetical protein
MCSGWHRAYRRRTPRSTATSTTHASASVAYPAPPRILRQHIARGGKPRRLETESCATQQMAAFLRLNQVRTRGPRLPLTINDFQKGAGLIDRLVFRPPEEPRDSRSLEYRAYTWSASVSRGLRSTSLCVSIRSGAFMSAQLQPNDREHPVAARNLTIKSQTIRNLDASL